MKHVCHCLKISNHRHVLRQLFLISYELAETPQLKEVSGFSSLKFCKRPGSYIFVTRLLFIYKTHIKVKERLPYRLFSYKVGMGKV